MKRSFLAALAFVPTLANSQVRINHVPMRPYRPAIYPRPVFFPPVVPNYLVTCIATAYGYDIHSTHWFRGYNYNQAYYNALNGCLAFHPSCYVARCY